MTCFSCQHFTTRAASDATVEPMARDLSVVGICRRWPPLLKLSRAGNLASVFPNIHRDNSCGEYSSGVPL